MNIPERLARLLSEKGVRVAPVKPSPVCHEGPPGFCAKIGRCALLGTLINQAEPGGGINDQQVGELIARVAAQAQEVSCNVLVKS